MDNRALISIIIPALHRPDLTAKCVASIRKQENAGSYEIVIVENDARFGLSYEESGARDLRSLKLDQNLGTTGSVNRALETTKAPYILLLNNDVELQPGFLHVLQKALDGNHRLAFATAKLLQAHKQGRLDGAGDALLQGGGAYRLGHGDADTGQFERATEMLAGCGAATLFRRSVLEELGGLDEQLFAYLDDVDLGLRAHLGAYEGMYVPDAVATHVGSATLGNPLHPRIVSWITRNQLLLVIKNYPGAALLRLLPRIFVYQVLWGLMVVGRGAIAPYLKGLLRTLWGLPRAVRERGVRQRGRAVTARQFIQALRDSERQIHSWHSGRPPASQSKLLKTYFRIFGAP